jgi:type I restriction enzyme M protein
MRAPDLLDDLQAIDATIGREASPDWNAVWKQVQAVLKKLGSKWRAPQARAFRDAFTNIDPKAQPVILKKSGTKVNTKPTPSCATLRTCPSRKTCKPTSSVKSCPMCPTPGWTTKNQGRLRNQLQPPLLPFTPPRPLAEIDADLKIAEAEIIRLLREVTGGAQTT